MYGHEIGGYRDGKKKIVLGIKIITPANRPGLWAIGSLQNPLEPKLGPHRRYQLFGAIQPPHIGPLLTETSRELPEYLGMDIQLVPKAEQMPEV